MTFPCRFTKEEFAEIQKREYDAETKELRKRLGIVKLEKRIKELQKAK